MHFAAGVEQADFVWPGALSELPCPALFEDCGEFVGEDVGPALPAELEPLDAAASLIPLAALLKTSVVAALRAPTATTRLPTSKSKRTAYSGADTPASSLPKCRNMLVPA